MLSQPPPPLFRGLSYSYGEEGLVSLDDAHSPVVDCQINVNNKCATVNISRLKWKKANV